MDAPDVLVQSFSVRPDEFLEITIVERRQQAEKAGIIQTIVLDPTLLRKEDLDELFATLTEFADVARRYIRTGETDEG